MAITLQGWYDIASCVCPQIIVHVGQKGHGDSVLRGVIKPFSRIPTQDPYEAYAFTTTVACAKFGEFSSMFSPSEIKENNSFSFNRVLTQFVLGP